MAMMLAVAAPALAQGAAGTVSGTLSANQQKEGPDTVTDPSDKAMLSFELAVESEPPANAMFLGFTTLESLMTTPLTDPDGDGTYTGSMTVPATSGGQGGPPEPLSLPVRIVQGPPTGYDAHGPQYRMIKDFGQVKIEGDKTFSASVSFESDGSSDNNDGSDNNGGSNNGGSGVSGSDSGSGGSSGGGGVTSSLRNFLPSTGGGMALTRVCLRR